MFQSPPVETLASLEEHSPRPAAAAPPGPPPPAHTRVPSAEATSHRLPTVMLALPSAKTSTAAAFFPPERCDTGLTRAVEKGTSGLPPPAADAASFCADDGEAAPVAGFASAGPARSSPAPLLGAHPRS